MNTINRFFASVTLPSLHFSGGLNEENELREWGRESGNLWQSAGQSLTICNFFFNLWQLAGQSLTISEKVYVFSSIFDNQQVILWQLTQKDLMKSMQFRQLSKIALPIVKDCLILVLILVTRSLHVLPPRLTWRFFCRPQGRVMFSEASVCSQGDLHPGGGSPSRSGVGRQVDPPI